MTGPRIVVGSPRGEEAALITEARRLRDAGAGVIFVGAGVGAQQLAATAVSEDVAEVVVADADACDAVVTALAQTDATDIAVRVVGC
ncbi:hypothetical protein D9V41_04625 [Aeromicrobium phragmitis]|uniref:Uncharacterized protein n=1 Tax=Aeromicrobium phragmitis TaxID=2478914 RepID=A0A3L8PM92_9ACTN|nr:hypothetical protein [Aeromicrobium phragmitis]RLV56380.1 hypothetical protein D9V41_04625 [Aeromicrobium phragmitis]